MAAWRKPLAAAAAVAVCAGATLLAALAQGYVRIPLVRAPKPSGAWAVGTITRNLASARTSDPLAVQVWYPAPAGARGDAAPYILRSVRPFRVRLLGAVVGTDAIAGAPIAEQRFPVIVYVPGWGGKRENNTALATNLASHGYVVVAMNDVRPDVPMDFSSETALRRTVAWAERKARIEATLVSRLLDALGRLDATPNDRFARRLDLNRIGVLGFSFGGAVAAESARHDDRIVAAVNLDGWLFGDALFRGIARPYLIVSTPLLASRKAERRNETDATGILARFDRDNEERQLAGLRRNGGAVVTIDGTDHYNFTDAGWLPSLRHTGVGPIDGRRAHAIVAAYVLAFFDLHVKRISAPLLDARSAHDTASQLITFTKIDAVRRAP